jgi:sigma-54 dependent transcriptional regulator, acetoin dehydrogenase operon transcriptional activator AcoR
MLSGAISSHAEAIHRVVSKAQKSGKTKSRLINSWYRSMANHELDPGRIDAPRILSSHDLKSFQVPMERFLRIARLGIERLHERIRDAGYVVLLTDRNGVTVDFLGIDALKEELMRAGLYLGGLWSESEEGTNGVGTCIADGQPIVVHKAEHFRAANIDRTCTAVPIFGPAGEVLAVLDASALSAPDDKKSQALVYSMVTDTAKLIENANFVDATRNRWLLRLAPRPECLEMPGVSMLALDETGNIIAATRDAREVLPSAKDLPALFGISLDELLNAVGAKSLSTPAELRTVDGKPWYFQLRSPDYAPRPPRVRPAPEQSQLVKFAGGDPTLRRAVDRARKLVNADLPFMLLGETGSGKERFARALHDDGPRAGKPFVALNCAAIPESLIESELFGYRQGAFTGARTRGMTGKVILADGGTLFLDEIGDMPLDLQSRLLRALSEKEVTPLGSETPLRVDVRFICASHRDLFEMVSSGRFREDLYYRLSGAVIRLPPLRDRVDLSDLIRKVLQEEIKETGIRGELREDTMRQLKLHSWPGNFRELHNVLRHALLLGEGGIITPDNLPEEFAVLPVDERVFSENKQLELKSLLEQHGWCIQSAASALGVARSTLYRQMDRLHIVPPNRRPATNRR